MFLQFLVAIFLILLVVERWKPRKFVKLQQQLGNNDWTYVPIIGHGLNFLGNNEERMTIIKQMSTMAYKNKHKAVSLWLGNLFFVVLADGDQACAVAKSALDKNFMHKFTKCFIGNGSIFGPVDIWHRRRKILAPAFAPRFVNQFVKVFEAQNKVLAELLESKVGKGDFSCFDSVSYYGMDSVCETLFGMNLDVQRQKNHPFIIAFTTCLKYLATRLFKPWLHIDAIYQLLPIYANQEYQLKQAKEFLDDLIYRKETDIYKNERNKEGTEDEPMFNFKSFLDLMVESSKDPEGYTREEIREELFVLCVAGTDTSAVATCFTILMLASHPDIQDKVYKEIQEVCDDLDKPLESKDLLKLNYLRAVIKESLRLFPPAPITARYCKKDLELPSGLVLPAGCNVVINTWGIHHNPQHWGEDVNDFNPDRFLSGQITPSIFLPFSFGSRNCIGQQYAMLSISTTMVTLLRRFRFIPATNFKHDNPLRLTFDIMMKSFDNFMVQIEHRNNKKTVN